MAQEVLETRIKAENTYSFGQQRRGRIGRQKDLIQH